MTKPIEWRLPDKTETKTIPGKSVRLGVYVPAEGYLLRWATPSDLASALAAMWSGERAEVIGYCNESAFRNEATARAEAAEREVPRLRLDAAQRDRDWTVIRTLTDAGARLDTTVEAVRRVVSERDSLLESVAAREKERDEAREARDRSTRLRDAMMPDTRAALDAEQYEDALTAARRVVAERDSLRTRLIAAETAAAQREPREYPLAEGSRWEGDEIVESDGMRLSYRRPFVAVNQHGNGVAMKVEARARNLAALLAKGGLL